MQGEINEVDDQILGLRADLTQLAGSNDAATAAQEAAIAAQEAHTEALKASAEEMKQLREEVTKQNAIATSTLGIGLREAQRALADMISGELGGLTSQRFATAGSGALMRL